MAAHLGARKGKRRACCKYKNKFHTRTLGQQTIHLDFEFPRSTGDFLLRAIIEYKNEARSAQRKVAADQTRRAIEVRIAAP